MNKRQAEQMMRQLGMKSEQIEATEVVIRTPTKEIVISEPDVTKINMMGQDTFQVVGRITERSLPTEPEISEEDIQTVMDSASVGKEEAFKAISDANGDLAQAILNIKK
ncbi:MAG: nascent polypeptide-associated complex protein [Nanoarchaeota archaeon]